MTDEQILGLVLFLLSISMRHDYTEEEVKNMGCWRSLFELLRLLTDFLCFAGAYYLLIVPAVLNVLGK